MKTIYDEAADTMFVRMGSGPIHDSEELRPGLILDFDQEGRIVAFEILNASRQVGRDVLHEVRGAEAA